MIKDFRNCMLCLFSDNSKPSPPALPSSRKPTAPSTPQPHIKPFSTPYTSNGISPPSPKVRAQLKIIYVQYI